jgi:quercetin dioxygenase-like cupin family protein
MKILLIAAAAASSLVTLPTSPAAAQPAAIQRTDLSRNDLTVSGREALQVLVEFGPRSVAPRHSHPGEELVFVVVGSLEYRVEGREPVTLHTGDTLFIPAGAIHAVTNVGEGRGAELATYIVEKGKQLVTPAE